MGDIEETEKNIFISWSQEKSKHFAELFKDFLMTIIHGAKPFLSTQDIEDGALWFKTLQKHLNTIDVGIICLTAENLERPYVLFEAGALWKGEDKNRIISILIDVKKSALLNTPLGQFQNLEFEKEQMLDMVLRVNKRLQNSSEVHIVTKLFDKMWPDFHNDVKAFKGKSAVDEEESDDKPATKADLNNLALKINTLNQIILSQTNASLRHNTSTEISQTNADYKTQFDNERYSYRNRSFDDPQSLKFKIQFKESPTREMIEQINTSLLSFTPDISMYASDDFTYHWKTKVPYDNPFAKSIAVSLSTLSFVNAVSTYR